MTTYNVWGSQFKIITNNGENGNSFPMNDKEEEWGVILMIRAAERGDEGANCDRKSKWPHNTPCVEVGGPHKVNQQ